jgi:hypothetical protein
MAAELGQAELSTEREQCLEQLLWRVLGLLGLLLAYTPSHDSGMVTDLIRDVRAELGLGEGPAT